MSDGQLHKFSTAALLGGLFALLSCQAAPGHAAVTTSNRGLQAASHTAGWIQVTPSGRYLQQASGTPFFSVGHDEAFGFFFQAMNPRGTLAAFMAEMKARGQNTLLVQVENEDLNFYGGHRLNLEYPLGTYNEEIARQFDELLDLAAANHLYVITYLWDTFHMDWSWEHSPYNVKNGGPCTYVSEMLTDPKAIALEERKLKWAIDRWGNRENLLAWDLMNEIEWAIAGPVPPNKDAEGHVHGATAEQMDAWVTRMGRLVHEYSLEKWGRSHLVTVSTNDPLYARSWFYSNPEIDLVTNHQYYPATNVPQDPLAAAQAVRDGVHFVLDGTGYRKPYMDTESGPITWDQQHPKERAPADAETYHATIWANWAAGACGAGMRWPYPNFGFGGKPFLNPLSPGMAQDLAALAHVAGEVDWSHFDSRPGEEDFVPSEAGDVAIASRDAHQLVGWLAREAGQRAERPVATHVRFSGFTDEPHAVRWYDDGSGRLLREDPVRGTAFELDTPAFTRHLAVVVRPVKN